MWQATKMFDCMLTALPLMGIRQIPCFLHYKTSISSRFQCCFVYCFFVNIVCSWYRDFSRFTLQANSNCSVIMHHTFTRLLFTPSLSKSFWSWTQFMTFMRRSHQSFVVTNTPLVLMSGSACASCGNRGWPGMNSANMVEEVHSANL